MLPQYYRKLDLNSNLQRLFLDLVSLIKGSLLSSSCGRKSVIAAALYLIFLHKQKKTSRRFVPVAKFCDLCKIPHSTTVKVRVCEICHLLANSFSSTPWLIQYECTKRNCVKFLKEIISFWKLSHPESDVDNGLESSVGVTSSLQSSKSSELQ